MTTLVAPTPDLDWRILSNVAVGGIGPGTTDIKDFWIKLKRILTNHSDYASSWKDIHGASATAPTACSVVYSSDGASNYGGTDYIASASNFVMNNGSNSHTYFVLSFPGIATNAQLLIDVAASDTSWRYMANVQEVGAQPSTSQYGGFYFSHSGGFSGNGGTLSRRPWAADEVQILYRRTMATSFSFLNEAVSANAGAGFSGKFHVMRTSDGACTRIVFARAALPVFFLALDVPGSPFHTNAASDHVWNVDDVPWIGGAYCWSSTVAQNAMLYSGTPGWMGTGWNTQYSHLVSRLASNANPSAKSVQVLTPVTIAYGQNAVVMTFLNESAANGGDGGYVLLPIWLACMAAGYVQPIAGKWRDIYLVGNNLTDGASGAEDALSSGYSWRKFGNFLLPWDRSACQMT